MATDTRTQRSQIGQVHTSLGEDALLLQQFVAREAVSTPFEITVDVMAPQGAVDFTPHIGEGVGLTVANGHAQSDRDFHGILYAAESLGADDNAVLYRLTLKPWFSLLALSRNLRLFQDMSAPDIIKAVFEKAGFTQYDFRLNQTYPSRVYCVQYRESDFNFVSRLLEEEGIYYVFEHAKDGHKLVLCDASANATSLGELELSRGDQAAGLKPYVGQFDRWVEPVVRMAELRDSNFQKPTTLINAKTEGSDSAPQAGTEYYDYPGDFAWHDDAGGRDGANMTQALLHSLRKSREMYWGSGDTFAVATGERIEIKDDGVSHKLFVTETVHSFGLQSYGGASGGSSVSAHVSFKGVPEDHPFHPARVTPKPLIPGVQTGKVVGPENEVVHVDKFGRVKVRFDWDRADPAKGSDEPKTCWIRVSQGWADGNFGQMAIPRVGEEVLVSFFDGDPDRPIVTGRVYNSALMPPYELPKEKTKSTWKSKTVGDTGDYSGADPSPPSSPGFNEIRFEDKGGSEEVYIHAQRAMLTEVLLDEESKINRDVTLTIGRDRTKTIKNNETVTLKEGSRTTTIQKNDTETLKTGDYSLKIDAGQATIEAAQKITLKVGENTIVISQQGIEIKGLMITAQAQTSLEAKSLTMDLKASAMMTINGALVMIN
jgi:type VI secretion system secreted protein VgrG